MKISPFFPFALLACLPLHSWATETAVGPSMEIAKESRAKSEQNANAAQRGGNTFTVKINATNVHISEHKPVKVLKNQRAKFNVSAKKGFMLVHDVGGTCPDGKWVGGTYHTGPITKIVTLTLTLPAKT